MYKSSKLEYKFSKSTPGDYAMQNIFEIQRACLRKVGHDFSSNNVNIKHWLVLFLVASAEIPMFYYTIYNRNRMNLATASLSITLTNIITVVKISTFLVYKKNFGELMIKLESIYREIHEPNAKNGLLQANQLARKLLKIYYYSSAMTGIYFHLVPISKGLMARIQGKTLMKELPMPMMFPFPYLSSPYYEFVFIYTAAITVAVVRYAVSVDGLFISFTINLRTHFQTLGYFIRSNDFEKAEVKLNEDVSSYVQYHSLLLELCNRVLKIYKPVIFGQFLMTSLQVCVIIYQLVTNIGSITVILPNCAFLTSIMLQLFIYCYGGEIVKEESAKLDLSIRISKWYKLPPKHQRMLALMTLRSQKQIIYSAGFYQATLESFMKIVKAAMSYITLIQSME